MHYAVQYTDTSIDILAGRRTAMSTIYSQFGVSYCEGGDVILVSRHCRYMWAVDDRRTGTKAIVVTGLRSACASDNLPGGRIYAINTSTERGEHATYGREGALDEVELPSGFNAVTGDGTRVYYADDRISYIDVASQHDIRIQPETAHRRIYPEATCGPLVYYYGGAPNIMECDTRSGVMADTDIPVTNIGSMRCMGDCLLIHRKILTSTGAFARIAGERIVAYDLRNRAEYYINEYTPYECTHFYI